MPDSWAFFHFFSEIHRFGFIHLLRCRFSLFARFLPLFAQIFSSSGLFDGRWHGSLEPHHGKFKWIWSDCVFDGKKCGKVCTSVIYSVKKNIYIFFTSGLDSSFISFKKNSFKCLILNIWIADHKRLDFGVVIYCDILQSHMAIFGWESGFFAPNICLYTTSINQSILYYVSGANTVQPVIINTSSQYTQLKDTANINNQQ